MPVKTDTHRIPSHIKTHFKLRTQKIETHRDTIKPLTPLNWRVGVLVVMALAVILQFAAPKIFLFISLSGH